MEDFNVIINKYDLREDPATLHEALSTYIAAKTDYTPNSELWEKMQAESDSGSELDTLRAELESTPGVIDEVAEAVLRWAYEVEKDQEAVESAIVSAKEKQAFIEVAALTVMGIYGMYLVVTGGVTKETIKEEKGADGSTKKTIETEYHSIGSVLEKVTKIFG